MSALRRGFANAAGYLFAGNPTLQKGWIGRGPGSTGRKYRGNSAGVAWVANFNNGNCNNNDVANNNYYVRAVRGLVGK